MKKIGLIYSFNSHKTKLVAEKITEKYGADQIDPVNAETVTEEQFLSYDRLILGVPTWFDGELPNYWDEFVPALEDLDLTGKKIAIYGLADQKGYPENFGDAVGLMADLVRKCGAEVVGETSPEGYVFESSRALQNGKFIGLIIDQENQARLTPERLDMWIEELKKSF
jgi:flavodoxin I